MSDVMTIIEYRLIRPDGTLLWEGRAPSYMGALSPPVRPGWSLYPEDYAQPPWRYEARAHGSADWTLLGEDLTP